MSRHRAGDIVVVDWRGGALPKEPTRLRPAVIVEDDELFPDDYPNTLVVPFTSEIGLAHRSFAVKIEPDGHNGVDSTCWALSHHLTSVSMRRVQSTGTRITSVQLDDIRQRAAVAIGLG